MDNGIPSPSKKSSGNQSIASPDNVRLLLLIGGSIMGLLFYAAINGPYQPQRLYESFLLATFTMSPIWGIAAWRFMRWTSRFKQNSSINTSALPLCIIPLFILPCVATIFYINAACDSVPAKESLAPLLEKHAYRSTARSSTGADRYMVAYAPLTASRLPVMLDDKETFPIRADIYAVLDLARDRAVVELHPGYFGLPWAPTPTVVRMGKQP